MASTENKTTKDTFQKRLIRAMEVRNIKAAELSKKTGLSKARISQYVNGVYEAKQSALYQLASALDISAIWLMGYGEESDYSLTADEIHSENSPGDTFRERLSEAMETRDITAAELSRKSGVTKSQLSHYLSGHYEAKTTILHKLAEALNVSEAWLSGIDTLLNNEIAQIPIQSNNSTQAHIVEDFVRLINKLACLDDIDKAKIEERIDVFLASDKYLNK